MMHSDDKVAAAILAAAAIKTIPGVRLNSMELQDLYRNFLRVVGEAGAAQPQPGQETWNGHDQPADEPIGLGIR